LSVVDHVVDLQHHALTHQELDDIDRAGGQRLGQFADGDDVGNDHVARDADLLLLAAGRGAFPFSRSRARRTEARERMRSTASSPSPATAWMVRRPCAALGSPFGARHRVLERGAALGALAAFFVQIVRTAIDFRPSAGPGGWRAGFQARPGAGGRSADAGARDAARRGGRHFWRGRGLKAAIADGVAACAAARRTTVGRRPVAARTGAAVGIGALLARAVVAIGGGAAGVAVVAAEGVAAALRRTAPGAAGRGPWLGAPCGR